MHGGQGKVLVVGAQGALGRLCVKSLRDTGFDVIRAGRRPESTPDFRLIDLNDVDSIPEACRDADLVISTVSHPALGLERFILREGGALLSAAVYSLAEREKLRAFAPNAQGVVITEAGGSPGVTSLIFKKLLAAHPEADEIEGAGTFSLLEPSGRGTAVEATFPAFEKTRRLPAVTVDFPEPFGKRRCLQLSGDWLDHALYGSFAERLPARTYLHVVEPPMNAMLLGLNALGLLSKLPLPFYTVGSRRRAASTVSKPQCHIAAVLCNGRRVAVGAASGSGNYLMTADAISTFAEVLLARRADETAPTGLLRIEDAYDLSEVQDGLEQRGIRITMSQ